MIIGLTGYAEAGKDSVGKILVEKHGFTRVAFADKLKELALVLNPGVAANVERVGWDAAKQKPEIRQYLQWLGDITRAVLGSDIWCHILIEHMYKLRSAGHHQFVVTDVRYPHEVRALHNAIRNVPAYIIGVKRSGHSNSVGKDHSSESSVSLIRPEYEIVNDGTLEDLATKVEGLGEYIKSVAVIG